MTKTEIERLAIVEEQIANIRDDVSEIKKDQKKVLIELAGMCKVVKQNKEDIDKLDRKTSSALWMTVTAIVSFIGMVIVKIVGGQVK